MEEFKPLIDLPWTNEGNPYGNLTEKQWKILNAALVVFTAKGYSAATTSEIAKVAGVAEGTIFRHFKTKKDILLATIIPLMQNLLGPGAAHSLRELIAENEKLPIEEVLLIIIEDRQKHIIKALPLLKVVFVESNFHPELREALIHGVALPSQEFFLRFIEQRQRSGELRIDLDSWALARSLVGAVAFYLFSRSMFEEREGKRENSKELKGIINIFLNGAKSENL
jgi:AcrR family transcriptional regulator